MSDLLQDFADSIHRSMRQRAGLTTENNMKTYDAATLAEMLGVREHQVHYLAKNGLIPKPLIHSGTVIRWSAEQVDYYLQNGMQKFREVYCAV